MCLKVFIKNTKREYIGESACKLQFRYIKNSYKKTIKGEIPVFKSNVARLHGIYLQLPAPWETGERGS